MKIWFERTDDMEKEMNKIAIECLDDPEYLYFFSSEYFDLHKTFEGLGWNKDAFLIKVEEKKTTVVINPEKKETEVFNEDRETVGYISWNIDRSADVVYNVGIILKKSHLNKGIGVRVLSRWLKYMMRDRGARKINFSCHRENNRAYRIYSQIVALGGREVGVRKKQSKLRDGQYHDLVLFEILNEDFKETPQFKKFCGEEKRHSEVVIM